LIDTHNGLVSFVNAGHPPPHLVSAIGGTKRINSKPAMPLGVRRQTRFQTRTLEILPGDALFLCSDGVFEALNDKGDVFSIERLGRLLREAHAAEPREMVRFIKDALDAFMGCATRTDDVTALALRWRPAEATAQHPMV
jgi:sigma-B regulation protein RsbU (phosphoserine phosphatase)